MLVRISVVIPVKNGAATLGACLRGLYDQTLPPVEILVIDSGSTDATFDVLADFPDVKVVKIPASEFDHGETRNFGASMAIGELVLFTVQDARSATREWLEIMANCLVSSASAAVCGGQIVPHEDRYNPVEWYCPQSSPRTRVVHVASVEMFDCLTPKEKQDLCGWDDVNAMYRRDVLTSHIRFRKTDFAEDAAWALDALRAGYTIAYCPAAAVLHSHVESYRYHVKRTVAVAYHRYKLFGALPSDPSLFYEALRAAKTLISRPTSWRNKAVWWWYNVNSALGIRRAARSVRKALQDGEGELFSLYQQVCREVPQANATERRK